MNKAEVDAIFDIWDTDGSGGIEFKELEYALKSGASDGIVSGVDSKAAVGQGHPKGAEGEAAGPTKGGSGLQGRGSRQAGGGRRGSSRRDGWRRLGTLEDEGKEQRRFDRCGWRRSAGRRGV